MINLNLIAVYRTYEKIEKSVLDSMSNSVIGVFSDLYAGSAIDVYMGELD